MMFNVEAEFRIELLDFILTRFCRIQSVRETGSKIFTERIRKTGSIMLRNLEVLDRRHLAMRRNKDMGCCDGR
jgi:hypothetical protein